MSAPEDYGITDFDDLTEDGDPENLLRALRSTAAGNIPMREPQTSQPDIDALKERYRRGELALDAYLGLLVDARNKGPEQDVATSASPNTVVNVEPAVAPLPATAANQASLSPPSSPTPPPSPTPTPTPTPAEVKVGTVLGERFELEECIARGGTADVYRARDLLAARYDIGDSTVCLKVLHRSLAADEELLAAVLRAAAQMRNLRHPHIEQVAELHRFDDDYVIVSEWLEGESLAQRLDRGGRLAAEEIRRVLTGVAAALEYLHEQGIAHGDIKPGNVFITAEGRVKLLDFGFYLSGRGAVPLDPPAIPRGITGKYASCEVLEGGKPLPADDIYSVACMTYRMVAGDVPYPQGDASGASAERLKPARPEGVSRRQWRALRRGLAFRRDIRPSHVAEIVDPFTTPRTYRTWGPIALVALLVLVAWLTWLNKPDNAPVIPRPSATNVPVAVQPTVPARQESAPASTATSEAAIATQPPPPAPAAALSSPEPARPATVVTPVVGFAAEQVVVSESDGYVKLTVRSVRALRGPVRLSVSTHSGAAQVNEDFVPPFEDWITLRPGQPSADVLVSLVNDTVPENAEDFSISLGDAQGAVNLGSSRVTVIISDDD